MIPNCCDCPCAPGVACVARTHPNRYGRLCEWHGGDEHRRRHIVGTTALFASSPVEDFAAPPKPSSPLELIPLAGDVLEAIAKRVGADRLAKWWEAKTGLPCGCEARREAMNEVTRKLLRWAGLDG